MKIIIGKDYEETARKAAIIVINDIILNPELVIGFATGDTPIGIYKELIQDYKMLKLDFSKVITFNLDEYYPIAKSNKQSYNNFMHENLFKYLNVDKNNINIPNGETKDIIKEIKEYEKKIKEKKIDLQILGIGRNGHIGFNEPGSSFKSKTRVINLDEMTIQDNSRLFKDISEVPRQAITMGIQTIMSAKKIVMIASGKSKAEAIKNMVKGKIDESCPASILQKHKNMILFLDKDAAGLI